MHRIMQETYIIFLLIDILVFIFPVSSVGYCVSGTVLHTSDGGAYTGTGYGPGCYMKFNLVLHTSDGGIY